MLTPVDCAEDRVKRAGLKVAGYSAPPSCPPKAFVRIWRTLETGDVVTPKKKKK